MDKLKRSGHFGERLKEIGVLGNLGEYFPEVFQLRVCQFVYTQNRKPGVENLGSSFL